MRLARGVHRRGRRVETAGSRRAAPRRAGAWIPAG